MQTYNKTYDSETEWVNAFAQGDELAEKQLFLKYFRPLCLYGERIVGNLHEAEDIATDVFVKLFDRRKHFNSIETIRSFLFRSARNASINFLSIEKNRTRIKKQLGHDLDEGPALEEVVENERMRAEVLHEIYQEIENLPEKCAQIFKMLFVEDKSTEEVAKQLNINVQTVRSQKSRAIQLLKAAFAHRNNNAAIVLLLSWANFQ